jgi:DNA repair exonuclease SbcCD ATPase subunit
MSSSNSIYLEFKKIISEQEEKSKNLSGKLTKYKDTIKSGVNTISFENEIEKEILSLKEAYSELENAYSNRNAPSQIAPQELDRRQKQIKTLDIRINELEKNYEELKSEKYRYKGTGMEDEYVLTDDMKNMDNQGLMQLQQKKLKEQDAQLDDIYLDAKKGTVLAKEAGKILEEQNKQLDELQNDMDKLDSRLQRGIKRFKDYAAKQSGCCITFILILELVAGFLIYFLM